MCFFSLLVSLIKVHLLVSIDRMPRANKALLRKGYTVGLNSFVAFLDWSSDSKYIQVNTDAYDHLYFSAPGGKICDQPPTVGTDFDAVSHDMSQCVLSIILSGLACLV